MPDDNGDPLNPCSAAYIGNREVPCDLTCIHTAEANRIRCGCGGLCDAGEPCPMADNVPLKTGLCPQCQEDYETDASAYLEYGQHEAGIRRWREECEYHARWEAEQAAKRWQAEEAGAVLDDDRIPW